MAQSMAWMVFAMLRTEAGPSLMKNLVREVDEVLGNGLPTYETHKKQKYAEAWYVLFAFVSYLNMVLHRCFPACPPSPLHSTDAIVFLFLSVYMVIVSLRVRIFFTIGGGCCRRNGLYS